MPKRINKQHYGLLRQHIVPEKKARQLGQVVYDGVAGTHVLRRIFTGHEPQKMEQALQLLDTFASAKNKTPTNLVIDPIASKETFPGTWAVSSNSLGKATEGEEQLEGIVQEMFRVHSPINAGQLAGLPFRRTLNNEILQLFDFQTGEGDSLAIIWSNISPTLASETALMAITDAALVAQFGSTYSYASRRFDRKGENNTASFMLLLRKVAWNAWSHDSYAADTLVYGPNVGATNEKEFIKKTWLWIQIADVATAVSDARSGTNVTPEAGHVITDVNVINQGNGSFHIIQTQRKQVNAVDETEASVLNPHGIQTGTLSKTFTQYENFLPGDLPAGASLTADVILNKKFIQGNGLWGRLVVTKIPTWAKTWSDTVKTIERNVGGHGLSELREAAGVPESGRAAAFTAAQTTSDANTRLVTMVRLIEKADGERVIQSNERRIWALVGTDDLAGAATVFRINAGLGRSKKSAGRWWPRRSETIKNTLVSTSVPGPALSDFTIQSILYTHSDHRVVDNGDGSFDVFQTGEQITTKLSFYPIDVETEVILKMGERHLNERDAPFAILRFLWITFQKIFDSDTAASDYADSSDRYRIVHSSALADKILMGPGTTKYIGNGKYAGFQVRLVDLTGKAAGDGDPWDGHPTTGNAA